MFMLAYSKPHPKDFRDSFNFSLARIFEEEKKPTTCADKAGSDMPVFIGYTPGTPAYYE